MPIQPDALVASDYVICATLRKIPNVFNVELLWERVVRSGQEGLFLMEALKRHPRAPQGRQRKETRYSHIIVRIPERDYVRDERLEDGVERQTLQRELHRLHTQELTRYLAEHTTIRYQVEADPMLRAGEVQFLFGRAIYLPDAGERPLFRIQVVAEKSGDWREAGLIYTGQRLTLLNGDRRASSFAVTAWPFPGGESVLLMLRPGAPALVDMVAEPLGGLTLVGEADGSFIAHDRHGRGLRLRVIAPGEEQAVVGNPALRRMPLKPYPAPTPTVVEPASPVDEPILAPEPPLSAADQTCPLLDPWGRREPKLGLPTEFGVSNASPVTPPPNPPDDPPDDPLPVDVIESPLPTSSSLPLEPSTPSGLDQHTWIPQRPVIKMRVLGIALQRLSVYAAAGISDWRIGFDRAGDLVPSSHPAAAAWLQVDSADRVFGEVVGLSTPLELPGTWQPFPELELELHAAPSLMMAHYLGWVRLPAPLVLPVPRGRAVSFGRGSEADIAPRLLADPRALRWEGNTAQTVGVNAEYLGLSRRHLRLQARRVDWSVQLESQNMPVYRLAPSGDLLDVLSPGVNTDVTAQPGELLVAGGYVLALGAVG